MWKIWLQYFHEFWSHNQRINLYSIHLFVFPPSLFFFSPFCSFLVLTLGSFYPLKRHKAIFLVFCVRLSVAQWKIVKLGDHLVNCASIISPYSSMSLTLDGDPWALCKQWLWMLTRGPTLSFWDFSSVFCFSNLQKWWFNIAKNQQWYIIPARSFNCRATL